MLSVSIIITYIYSIITYIYRFNIFKFHIFIPLLRGAWAYKVGLSLYVENMVARKATNLFVVWFKKT